MYGYIVWGQCNGVVMRGMYGTLCGYMCGYMCGYSVHFDIMFRYG